MTGIAAVLASCSQNELVTEPTDSQSDVTILTAALDNGMKTRAVDANTDDAVERCLVQVYSADGTAITTEPIEGTGTDGSYTFAVTGLNDTDTYTFLFWADGGINSYDASSLKDIKVAEAAKTGGIGIAYHCKKEATKAGIASATDITLTHAVAKITLNTTSALESGKEVKMTVPTYYGFDASTGTITGTESSFEKTYSEAVALTDGAASAHVFSIYVLGATGAADKTLTISYDGKTEKAETIANLPIAPNKHITLVGDISALGDTPITVQATLNNGWEDSNQSFPAASGE